MKKPIIKVVTSIRFRQWSRKSYAIFSGLHKIITIGHVSADICEKAQLKNNLLSVFSPQPDENCYNTEREEEPVTDFSFVQPSLLILPFSTSTDYPAGFSSRYLLTKGWNRENSLFQPFNF